MCCTHTSGWVASNLCLLVYVSAHLPSNHSYTITCAQNPKPEHPCCHVPGGNAGEVEKLVPADALLLAGTCIVDESVLTGESTPQWKAAVSSPEELTAQGEGLDHRLSIKRDKNHVLFSGTTLLQHTGDKEAHIKTPDGACLAVVLRTGFETSQGMRSLALAVVLYSSELLVVCLSMMCCAHAYLQGLCESHAHAQAVSVMLTL